MTPIDWKPVVFQRLEHNEQESHHSLETPIDWKLFDTAVCNGVHGGVGHHSLVTPIDWKPRYIEVAVA